MRKSVRFVSVIPFLIACVVGLSGNAFAAGTAPAGDAGRTADASECAQRVTLPAAPMLSWKGAKDPSDSSVSAAGGCFTACYDLETSHEVFGCPQGQRFAMDATGLFSACCLVGGGECVSSGCTVLARQCVGFASNCWDGCF